MSAHVDPIPREARPFQGRRAGLVTRIAAAAIDFGIIIIALGVGYLGVSAFLFLLDPRNFTAPAPSPLVMLRRWRPAAHRLSRGELEGQRSHIRQPRHGVARREPQGQSATSTRLPRPCGPLRHLSVRAALGARQWPQPLTAGSRRAHVGDLRLGRTPAAAPSGAGPDLSPTSRRLYGAPSAPSWHGAVSFSCPCRLAVPSGRRAGPGPR